jgi:hypothetical protein
VDVVRAVLEVVPGADLEEGLLVATGQGRAALVRFLVGKGARCTWSPTLRKMLMGFPPERALRALGELVGAGGATREFAEGCLALSEVLAVHWWQIKGMWPLLRAMGVEVGSVLAACRGSDFCRIAVLQEYFGGSLSGAGPELYEMVPKALLPWLIEEGVPLPWRAYGDGKPCLWLLTLCSGWKAVSSHGLSEYSYSDEDEDDSGEVVWPYADPEVIAAVTMALQAAGADVSRHHYCMSSRCCRGYAPAGRFAEFLMQSAEVCCQDR